jgi:hypothetical protein
MPPSKAKRPSFTAGFTVLALQALTTPFVVSRALQATADQPSWFTGLFLALDLGSIASLAILAFGMRTGRPAARFAPMVLVLPAWLVVAILAPIQEPSTAPAYALSAGIMGLLAAGTFVRPGAEARFERPSTRAQHAIPSPAPQA